MFQALGICDSLAYFLLEMGGRFSDTLILVPVCILVFGFGIAVDVMEYTL